MGCMCWWGGGGGRGAKQRAGCACVWAPCGCCARTQVLTHDVFCGCVCVHACGMPRSILSCFVSAVMGFVWLRLVRAGHRVK